LAAVTVNGDFRITIDQKQKSAEGGVEFRQLVGALEPRGVQQNANAVREGKSHAIIVVTATERIRRP